MSDFKDILIYLLGFVWILFGAAYFSKLFLKIKLPLITGFIVTGMLVGPYFLDLIPKKGIEHLHFVNYFSLAFIAFAAGSELYLKDLRSRLRSIAWNTFGQLVLTFVLSALAVYLLASAISFMVELPETHKVAVSLLMATIFVARSPSSAIAIVHELRAKGPFTQTVMGVTVIKDVLVIILFAISVSISKTLISDQPFHLSAVAILILELSVSLAMGLLLGKLLDIILSFSFSSQIKAILILFIGTSVFGITHLIQAYSEQYIGFEVFFEPLLICIIGSFAVTNYSRFRTEFQFVVHRTGPFIYLAFFTLTGIMVSVEILAQVWVVALILFFVRLVSMVIGAYVGATLAKDEPLHKKVGWMPYVTQAGVGLGLAIEVAEEFPVWGSEFATVVIAVIILNQFAGPPLFKWALNKVGESHKRAGIPGFDGVQDAIIFGLEDQSLALARQLKIHSWEVSIATLKKAEEIDVIADIDIRNIDQLDKHALDVLDAKKADAVILMLSDVENYKICELIYELVGTKSIVVRLNDRKYFKKFHELGCLVVDPGTAMVSLLDNFVRSPMAASLLLGGEDGQSTVDLEVRDNSLHGVALRNLRLPSDIIVLSVKRKGQTIISHGYTRLRKKDIVTVVGSLESLNKLRLMFGAITPVK